MASAAASSAMAGDAHALFVIAAHVPSKKNCAYLARTVHTILLNHRKANVLVVDNDSPQGNIGAALNIFVEAGFASQLHVSAKQAPSRGQLGSWLAAYAMLQSGGALGKLSIDRVLVLQHSTRLLVAAPTRPPNCSAASLSGHRASDFELNRQREYRRDGPNALFSAIAANALHVTCQPPCLNASSWQPIAENTVGARPWTMVPHATLDFSYRGFLALGDALTRGPGAHEIDQLYKRMDAKQIPLKELNGQLERFGGLMMAWLNGFNRTCERPGNRTKSFVAKKHGKTFGGSWRAADAIRVPKPERCSPRHWPNRSEDLFAREDADAKAGKVVSEDYAKVEYVY